MKDKNFFREFKEIKESITDNNSYSEKAKKLLTVIQEYLDTLMWVEDEDFDITVYKNTFSNLHTYEIAEMLGLNNSTYRTRLTRLSKRIKKEILEGMNILEVINANDNIIQEIISNISYKILDFKFPQDINIHFYREIKLYISNNNSKETNNNISELDILEAIKFLERYSEYSFKENLNRLNPTALATVMKALEDTSACNEIKQTYLIISKLSPRKNQISAEMAKKIQSVKNRTDYY